MPNSLDGAGIPIGSGPNGGMSSFIADWYASAPEKFTRLSDSSTKRTSSARKRMSMSAIAPFLCFAMMI